jgi:peptide/nickel transport system substrate-binding protein/oligopeptide transport system substrate-binding protein
MQSTMRGWLRFIAVLAVLTLVLVACGDGAEDTTTTAAPGETTTTTTTQASAGTSTTLPPEPEVEELAGLTIIDDLTFQVELTIPDPEFPIQMAYAAYFPLPSVALEDPQAFEESPIGNGPFQVDGVWEHDVSIKTTRWEDYPGSDAAQIDQLEFLIIDDLNTAYNEVRAGTLDVLGPALPTDQIATAADEFGDRYGLSSTTSFTYLGFPSYLDFLTPERKQALSMAIDRQLIVDVVYSGTRVPAFSAIPPVLPGARTDVCENWNYNPDEAKALWDAAGPLDEITVWFNTGGGHEEWVEAVANMWRQTLGVEVVFESMEFSEYLPFIDNQELTGPFRLGWGQDYPSPLNFLEPLYASYNFAPVGSNSTFFDNAEFDAFLAQGKEAVAASGLLEDGIPFYHQAEEVACAETTIAPVWFRTNQFVYTEGIDNVFFDSYSDLGYTKITSDDGYVSYQVSEPEHLFPTTTNESNGIAVLRSLFSPLVQFDWETAEPFNLVADSISSDDNGQTWTIAIAPGWTFHNGEAVTAASFVNAWNYGAIGANGQQNNSFYSNIVGYDVLNPEE